MVIITADDYGKTRQATDSIIECFANHRITSASAMVFMEDSERAAAIAERTGLEVGLHLNFTMPFSTGSLPERVRTKHQRIISYLTGNKPAQVIYNPALAKAFDLLFRSQLDEFSRLYGRLPDFYNGHHHMHLCANVLFAKMIPKGARVRRTFTFVRNEKSPFNRFYRHILDAIVSRRFTSTDYFFSILPLQNSRRLRGIFDLAVGSGVEIEVHPENAGEREFLLSEHFAQLLNSVTLGSFGRLDRQITPVGES